jgi:hypothetical protein
MHYYTKDTLTALEMDRGEVVDFHLASGAVTRIALEATEAQIVRTTLKQFPVPEEAARTDYRFTCALTINGREHVLAREASSQRSFYEPWEIDGVRIWFDAVDDIFNLLTPYHGEYRPRKQARFALQDATRRICPERLHPWCPLPEGGLRIEECFRGEDCWLAAFDGSLVHCGLDINHAPGTPLWAPLAIDDHFYYNSLEMGHNNNRWRGIHRWADGSEWILQACHMTALTVPEHTPLRKGQQFALGAGVFSGGVDHSHFVFKVHNYGETIPLDPWILFWQMYRDQDEASGLAGAEGSRDVY